MPLHPPFVNIFFHHDKQVQIHQSFSFPCNIFQAIPNTYTSLLEYRNQKSKRLVFHQTCLYANLPRIQTCPMLLYPLSVFYS